MQCAERWPTLDGVNNFTIVTEGKDINNPRNLQKISGINIYVGKNLNVGGYYFFRCSFSRSLSSRWWNSPLTRIRPRATILMVVVERRVTIIPPLIFHSNMYEATMKVKTKKRYKEMSLVTHFSNRERALVFSTIRWREKIKKIREIIKQDSINKRISENKRMVLQHK